VTEAFDEVVKYIDFVNQQVGAYMDTLAGFAAHYARVGRQLHRVNRPVKSELDDAGRQVVVWASYEDPTKPDVIHNRIIRAQDYLAVNSPGGSNEQQHARAIVVFLFTYWEDEIRPRLAKAKGVAVNEIRCDAMSDLRVLRIVILPLAENHTAWQACRTKEDWVDFSPLTSRSLCPTRACTRSSLP
jgi:hypothetical protein